MRIVEDLEKNYDIPKQSAMMEYLQKSEDTKQKTNNHQTKEALMHLNDKIAIASQLQWGIQALDFSYLYSMRRVTEVEIQESGRLLPFLLFLATHTIYMKGVIKTS